MIHQRMRIDLSQPESIEYWTRTLNINPEQLKAAVNKVGNIAYEVMDYLGGELEDRNGDESLFYYRKPL